MPIAWPQPGRLRGVLAAVIARIVADEVHDHRSDHAIPPGDLRRRAGKRHEAVDECRIALAPDPGVHASHRRAHRQPQVIDSEPLRQQLVLGVHHVVVRVLRKPGVQSVTRLARVSVADAVRQNDEVLRRVEQLARAEQLAGERATGECRSRAGGAVIDDHGVADHAGRHRAGAGPSRCSGFAARAASRPIRT